MISIGNGMSTRRDEIKEKRTYRSFTNSLHFLTLKVENLENTRGTCGMNWNE